MKFSGTIKKLLNMFKIIVDMFYSKTEELLTVVRVDEKRINMPQNKSNFNES